MTSRTCRYHVAASMVAIVGCVLAISLTPRASAQELLGYWKLDEANANGEAIDSSGNNLHGTYDGGVDPGVDGAPGFGMGAHFDGSGQIIIGAGDETGFGDLTGDFTVMAWINPEQFGHKNRVFGSNPHGGAGWGWGTNGDQLEITTWGIKDYTQPVPLEADVWVHAAITLNEDNEALFYVDGELVGTQTHSSPGNTTINDFAIGFACCSPEFFEGRLDEVGIFSGVLSEEQINNAMMFGVDGFNGPVGATLQPGDSDQDLDFDQLDLVKVQIAGKYLTGAVASWGEGDWNGAPGGSPGSPPAGNARFDQLDIIAALNAGIYLTGPYGAVAGNGVAGDGQTSVTYNPATGEVGVDAPAGAQLTSVNIDSAAGIFTGQAAVNLGGSFDNDADGNIFKATFGGSFGSVTFGNVAQIGLARDFVLSDLTVVGSLAGGGALGNVDLVYVPEPSSLALVLLAVVLGLYRRR